MIRDLQSWQAATPSVRRGSQIPHNPTSANKTRQRVAVLTWCEGDVPIVRSHDAKMLQAQACGLASPSGSQDWYLTAFLTTPGGDVLLAPLTASSCDSN